MQVKIGAQIRVINPTLEFMRYCNDNFIIRNPEYDKKARMGLWNGNVPQYLMLAKLDAGDYILPFGTLREIYPLFKDAKIDWEFPTYPRVHFPIIPSLYDYQQKAVDAMVGAGMGILKSRPGSGKTRMGLAIAARLEKKTLWLTHTQDLLEQSYEAAKEFLPECFMGRITEGKVQLGSHITFATIQTMCNLDLSEYENTFGCVITDECHRVAGTPTTMTMFSKVLNHLCCPHKYGLSATVHRADGMIKATFAMCGQIAYSVPDEDVADRVMRVGISPCYTNARIGAKALNADGTINYTRLIQNLCENDERNDIIIGNINREYSDGMRVLVLSDRLAHLETLMNGLSAEAKADAVMISGRMQTKKEKAARQDAVNAMRDGRKKILFATYSLAKEGLDIPVLERLMLTTPQKDYAVVSQSIGRIARKADGKKDPVVIDFVDADKYFVRAWKKRCSIYKQDGCYMREQ